jgi:hypothetical protein
MSELKPKNPCQHEKMIEVPQSMVTVSDARNATHGLRAVTGTGKQCKSPFTSIPRKILASQIFLLTSTIQDKIIFAKVPTLERAVRNPEKINTRHQHEKVIV